MGVPSVLLFALLFVVKPLGFRFGAPLCGVMVPVAHLWPPERSAVAAAQILVSGLVGDPLQPRAGRLTLSATTTLVLKFQNVLCWIGNMGTIKMAGSLSRPSWGRIVLQQRCLMSGCPAVLLCRFRPADGLSLVRWGNDGMKLPWAVWVAPRRKLAARSAGCETGRPVGRSGRRRCCGSGSVRAPRTRPLCR